MLLYFIILSIALSIDALGIGISYRISGVTIPAKTKGIIGVVTTFIMLIALMLGNCIHKEVPNQLAQKIGAFVLIMIGLIFLYQCFFQKKDAPYDLNHSRCIEPIEGILLAMALSGDSIGAGIAVASTGIHHIFFGILVGVFQFGFLVLADYFVDHVSCVRKFNQKICGFISGFLLILIGFLRFFS